LKEQLSEVKQQNADFIEVLNVTKSDAAHCFEIGIENAKLKEQLAEYKGIASSESVRADFLQEQLAEYKTNKP
jgi:hypothetical protein